MIERNLIAIVVIGRNEGERLKRCLQSMPDGIPIVYVDSGSTDGSVDYARSIGVTVVPLDMSIGFTAARARNVGWRHLVNDVAANLEFVQFVDGDCELEQDWMRVAIKEMQLDKKTAAVFGRLRERFPDLSIFNRICDDEWDAPIGVVPYCGGNAVFRTEALKLADGYSDDLIAGEEPELCLRLRAMGWIIRRVDAEMGLHDANILTLGSWWRRTKRGGFAYAAHVLRHGVRSDPQWRRQLKSIIFWGLIWPVGGIALVVLLGFWQPLVGVTLLTLVPISYGVQALRIAARKQSDGFDRRFALSYGVLLTVGKFAEMGGVLQCWTSHLLNRQARLIEYKRPKR